LVGAPHHEKYDDADHNQRDAIASVIYFTANGTKPERLLIDSSNIEPGAADEMKVRIPASATAGSRRIGGSGFFDRPGLGRRLSSLP
jgi:hypothetical protein